MAEIINLRRERKRAEARRKDDKAAANRVLHGLPKALRQTASAERERSAAQLDAHRLDDAGAMDGGPAKPGA
ncbi:DUF4169 family protein [Mangrovicella endophytica]|uniref:DUF4169 family protein n=1 Tax=Mangrovicella endophytica TaxID=2066697 RepID=UPI000C9E2C3D|nr:DUF4169 family protein [Mangrovicella endophytica]